MPENQPFPRSEPAMPEPWLDRLLDGSVGRGELTAEDAALVDVLAAVTAPPSAADLVGFEAALAAFVAAHERDATPVVPAATGSRLSRRLRALPVAAVTAVAGVLTVGGLAAAAYTGSLPPTLQDIAHRTIGAPGSGPGAGTPTRLGSGRSAGATPAPVTSPGPVVAPPPSGAPGASAPGPSSVASAAGLCEAFSHGGLAEGSPAYRTLESAAAGHDVVAYCAGLLGTPTSPAPARPTPSRRASTPRVTPTHPSGRPSTNPAGRAPGAASTTRPQKP